MKEKNAAATAAIIGIDISKATLDLCIKAGGHSTVACIENETRAIKALLGRYDHPDTLIAMENTGRYNTFILSVAAGLEHARVFVINALHLKKSMGLVRGKNDLIDASRICSFMELHQNDDNLIAWKPASEALLKLEFILTEREGRVKMRKQLLNQCKDHKLIKNLGIDKMVAGLNAALLDQIDQQIAAMEHEMETIIKSDPDLQQKADLIRSVPGAGKVLSWALLTRTKGFTILKDPRKLACYAGVVPFPHRSGTSIRGKERISYLADKKLKQLLHMSALRAITLQNDLKQYYQRKVADGKNKMSVINAVRNKLIHRICAAVNLQKPYINYLATS